MKTARLLLLSTLPLWALTACSPPKPAACDATTCAGGCCDASGQCQIGVDPAACGTGGNLCTQCFTGQSCVLGLCRAGTGGGGGGTGGGTGGGGGGGTTGGGTGVLSCAAGKTACSGTCVDLQTSERNCGNCGSLCNSNQYCAAGNCTVLPQGCAGGCPRGFFCAANECKPGCAADSDCPQPGSCDTRLNVCSCLSGFHGCGETCEADNNISACGPSCANCGGIANAVPACTSSSCDFTCNQGFHRCGNECKDNNNVAHCGSSCTPCTPPPNSAAICNGTSCDFVCNPGFHRCGNQCVDNASVNSCGATSCTSCSPPANGTATCNGVSCDFVCNSGYHRCGSQCLPNNSTASCGTSCTACTPPSNSTATCNGTSCGFSCNTGTHGCSGQCVSNLSTNSCGTTSCTPCSPPLNGTATCNGVSCDFTCNSGTHRCGTSCSSNTSVSSCGSTSCTPCPAGPANSTRTCDGVSCGWQCNSGYHDCNGQCVSDFSTTQCGLSCTTCTAPANGSAICSTGSCDFACNTGFHRCGTECKADADADACGSSCTVCPAGPANSARVCATGFCTYACNSGFNDCGGECLGNDFVSACGSSCTQCTATGTLDKPTCSAGACGTSCITSCNSMCVDVNRDPMNCGACNATCSGGQTCTQGECRATCATGVGFANVVPFFTGANVGSAYRFVMEDVNNDGRVDLIDNGNTGVQVRLSNADGTFAATAQTWSMTSRPIELRVVDLDGDGFKDIVALRSATSTQVFVVRNNAGTLATTGTSYAISTYAPSSMAVLDANGDSRLDIVVATTSQVFAVLPQSTTPGTFGTFTTSTSGLTQPFTGLVFMRAAQLDADGRTDLVVANTVQYRVLRQTGVGIWTSAPSAVSQTILSIEVADLNGNATQDLLIRPSSSSGTVIVGQGNNDGTFTNSTVTFPGVSGVVGADLNADGNLDLVSGSTGLLYVGLATGPGTWPTTPPSFLVNSPGNVQNLIGVGQIIGDARPELFSTNSTNVMSVLLNDGMGGFSGARVSGTTAGFTFGAAGDLDGDGDRDLVLSPSITAGTTANGGVVLGNSNGSFGGVVSTPLLSGTELSVGRLNTDAMEDLVVGVNSTTVFGVDVFLSSGGGTFGAPTRLTTTAAAQKVLVVNLDGDTANDVLVATSAGLEWFQGMGDGSFGPSRRISTSAAPTAIAVGDVNLDGRVDVVANVSSAVRVYAGLGSSNFTLNAISTATSAAAITDLAVVDLDNDGRPDVAAAAGSSGVYLYKGAGNGTLTYQSSVAINGRMRAADLDNDGFVDLAVVTSTGELHTSRGSAGLVYATRQTWAPGRTLATTALIVDRVNTDSFRDVVVLANGEVWTYLGLCR